MMTFENSITIECPPDEVFAFVADFENVPKWNYYVLEVRKISKEPVGEGTRYHQTRKQDQQEFTITEYERGKALAVETTPDSKPRFVRRMVFEHVNGRTRITDHWQLALSGIGLIDRLATSRVKSAVSENLGKLKELLETGHVELQDGRVTTSSMK